MNYNIKFSPWLDPLNTLVKTDEDGDSLDYKDKDDNFKGPLLYGPFGIVPLHEGNIPSRLFNFWTAHTNFRITDAIVDILNNVDGVETLDITTPYRMRIGIGQLFQEDSVKREIERKVIKEHLIKNQEKSNLNFETLLKKNYKFWASFNHNAEIKYVYGNTKDEVANKLNLFEKESVSDIKYSWESNGK